MIMFSRRLNLYLLILSATPLTLRTNMRLGYSVIEIRSPKDLVNYGND